MTCSDGPASAPRLTLLDPGRRTALEIRYAVAAVFRSGGLPGTSEVAAALLRDGIVGPALARSNVARALPDVPRSRAVAEVRDLVHGVALPDGGPAFDAIRTRSDDFRARLERAGCVEDAPMPDEIAALFGVLDGAVARLYGGLDVAVRLPAVHLALGRLHSDQVAGLLDSSALSGSCRWSDGSDPVSVVTLSVRDDAFDWDSACHLPYVLAHELVCHAYQGTAVADCAEPRRQVDGSCAWSEGWMDVIALWLVEEWVRGGHVGKPAWIVQEATDVLRACNALNARRIGAQATLPPIQRGRRIYARRAVDRLRAELDRFGDGDGDAGTSGGRNRVLAFSLALNAVRLPQADRDRVVDALGVALETSFGVDRDDLIAAVVDFSRTGDVAALRRALADYEG